MPDGIDFHGRESNADRYAPYILHANQHQSLYFDSWVANLEESELSAVG